jgi:putative copper export protein
MAGSGTDGATPRVWDREASRPAARARVARAAVLTPSWDTLRLFLHVLAASVWVGGQLTLAALVPTLRRLGTELPKAAARQFAVVAWPAFAVLIATGVWNVFAERSGLTGAHRTTLIVKIAVVAVSGVTAALHARSRTRTGLAVFGALTGVSALAALLLGVLLAD